jgi:hypothetical protein
MMSGIGTNIQPPFFIFIGPSKSGSTWLYHVLREHKYCFVPKIKDIYFFDRYYERGWEWYLSFFKDIADDVKIMGELSHDYLHSTQAAIRIAKDLPDVRLITTLRNPVDRAFSEYLFLLRNGWTKEPFEKAIEIWPELINKGLYFHHLSIYYQLFDRSQIGVFFFNDFVADPENFAKAIFRFLEIPFSYQIDYAKKVLPASKPKNYIIARLIKIFAKLARNLKADRFVGAVKNTRFVDFFYRPYSKDEKPKLDIGIKKELLETFRPDIQDLQNLLDTNLSYWFDLPDNNNEVSA